MVGGDGLLRNHVLYCLYIDTASRRKAELYLSRSFRRYTARSIALGRET
jgi:hypothetical protein